MQCVVSRMVRPCSLNRSISSQSWRRACGSRPVVGSSRNRKSGSPTSAQASASRCFCPPERPPTREFIFSSSCTRAITSDGGGPCRKKLRNNPVLIAHLGTRCVDPRQIFDVEFFVIGTRQEPIAAKNRVFMAQFSQFLH